MRKLAAFFTSMRLRLFILFLLCGIVPCIFMRQSVLGSYESRAVTVRSGEVQNQCYLLAGRILAEGYLDEQNSPTIEAEITQLADVYAGRVLVVNNSYSIIRDTFSMDEGKTIVSEEAFRALDGSSCDSYNEEEGYIEVAVPIVETDSDKSLGAVIATVSTAGIQDSKEVLTDRSGVVLLLIIFVMVFLSLLFCFYFEKPVRNVRKAIQSMALGHEDSIPAVRTYPELQTILSSYNQSVARLNLLDESRKEFVSNVSHELKTPIASIKVLADSLLMQEDVPQEMYREFLQDISLEIERETNIINDLLTLVRLENKDALEISSVDINALMEYILKRLRPIASQRNIELVLESFRPVTAEVDEAKLSAAFTNFVENSVKYNKDGGYVHVSVNADHQYFYVRIEDTGIGIPKEDQEHIFERFYRVDKSHSKEIKGTGLGLSIARHIIQQHRGLIHLYSNEGEGTTFNIRIPLTYVEAQGGEEE